jgi:hypothetical protein
MNVTVSLAAMPKIRDVVALADHRVRVTWQDSLRPHMTEDVDLSPLIQTLKFYEPLRNRKSLFRSVHVIDGGNAIAWGANDEVDMAATSVERLAEEALSADDFRAFLLSNKLTQQRAAIVLGRSPRQVANYLCGKQPIPRVVVLACYGYLARKQQQALGGLRDGSNVFISTPRTSTASVQIVTSATVAA